ncbi:peptidoglycan-binding domain-containing protein [Photobacterium indicum]|uniref:peptidoglycan-binding domain-containing protein n=1 Tax=Photobacterium indicum TaxID=81447 RepID=UPI003D0EE2AC
MFSYLSLGVNLFEVLKIQEALVQFGFELKVDGRFGSITEDSVKQFQKIYAPTNHTHNDYQIGAADGIIGKNTILAFDEAVNEKWHKDNEIFHLGWLQNTITQPQSELWQNLFTPDTPVEKQRFIKQCNDHLNDPVKEGEIVIIPTVKPSTSDEKQTLSELKEEVKPASKELAKLTPEEAATANRHFELLDDFASKGIRALQADGLPSDYYAYASLGVGMAASGVEQHLKNINGVLLEVNNLYVDRIKNNKTGYVNYQQFFDDRAQLLKKLDGSFAGLSKRSVQIPAYQQVKKNLKLSIKSVIHHADEILKTGYVKNIGKRMANVAIGVSAAKGVGYVGLTLGAASGVNNIYEACNVDSTGNCGKTTSREVGGFLGGMALGGQVGTAALAGTVLVLGTVSAPVLAIASVGAIVVGGAVGGVVGATGGKAVGDIAYFVYEWVEEQF